MTLLALPFMLLAVAAALRPSPWAHRSQLRRALADASIPATSALSISASASVSLPLSSFLSTPSSVSSLAATTAQPSSASPSSLGTSPVSSLSSSTTSSTLLPSSSIAFSSTGSSFAAASTASAGALAQPSSSSSPFVTGAGVSSPGVSSSVVFYTVATATPSSTATHPSSSGFFSNSAAVAGTFTVVGLASVSALIAVALLIVRRRHSRSYEEDTEYLDKTPDLSSDPSTTQVTSIDHGSSDNTHYGVPPVVLATPPVAYYPDHAYALHPQAFQAESYHPPGLHGYTSQHTQDYAPQHMYPPDDYNIGYPPSGPSFASNMPNPHEFGNVELDSSTTPSNQTTLPNALRPSVRPTTASTQWASARFSVDSFYTGIVTDTAPPAGQAI